MCVNIYNMQCLAVQYYLNEEVEVSHQLRELNLLSTGVSLKLHLGCGEKHLTGYINIDYPLSEHTIQTKSGADVFGDITKIVFLPGVVDEIRLHHVLEHFDRPTALALLCAWHIWLRQGGILHIEVPDFLTSVRMVLAGNHTYVQKQIILRHIFGSHEASWAIHCDGWYKEKFEHILATLGFKEIEFQSSSWLLTHNITVRAKKTNDIEFAEMQLLGRKILSESLVDTSLSEQKMLDDWYQKFDKSLRKLLYSVS
jgi:predicted SAM-dependent methyltransferase